MPRRIKAALDRTAPDRFFLALAIMFVTFSAQAAQPAVIETVQGFLYEQSQGLGDEINIEVIPPRATLPACESPSAFFPNASSRRWGRVSVGVRCGADGRQVRYLQANIQVFGSYPVTATDIDAGQRITEAMLGSRQGDLSQLPPYTVMDARKLIGLQATRSLRAGTTLNEHQVREIPSVLRGQRVSVEARGRGFRVSREGEALEDGGHGETIRVRLSRREILDAIVVGPQRVAVGF